MAIVLRPQLKAELRRRYARLQQIPGNRWHSVEGQAFLGDLSVLSQRHSNRQLGDALGVTPQAVSRMLRVHDPTQLYGTLRTKEGLAKLASAHAAVLRWRAMGRQVRRTHKTYHLINDVLSELVIIYEVPTIAKLSGLRAQELHRFMEPPDDPMFDDLALLALVDEYDAGRALLGPKRRAFLSQLEETLASHALVDVARVLNVAPRVVRTWMVERTHGQHPEGTANP